MFPIVIAAVYWLCGFIAGATACALVIYTRPGRAAFRRIAPFVTMHRRDFYLLQRYARFGATTHPSGDWRGVKAAIDRAEGSISPN